MGNRQAGMTAPTAHGRQVTADAVRAVWYLEARSRTACLEREWWDDAVDEIVARLLAGDDATFLLRRLGARRAETGFSDTDVRADITALLAALPSFARPSGGTGALVAPALRGWHQVVDERPAASVTRRDDVTVAAAGAAVDGAAVHAELEALYAHPGVAATRTLLVVDVTGAGVGPGSRNVGDVLARLAGERFPDGAWIEILPGRRFGLVAVRRPTLARSVAALRAAFRTSTELSGLTVWAWTERLPEHRADLATLVSGLAGHGAVAMGTSPTDTEAADAGMALAAAPAPREHGHLASGARRRVGRDAHRGRPRTFETRHRSLAAVERLLGVAAGLLLIVMFAGVLQPTSESGPVIDGGPVSPGIGPEVDDRSAPGSDASPGATDEGLQAVGVLVGDAVGSTRGETTPFPEVTIDPVPVVHTAPPPDPQPAAPQAPVVADGTGTEPATTISQPEGEAPATTVEEVAPRPGKGGGHAHGLVKAKKGGPDKKLEANGSGKPAKAGSKGNGGGPARR